MKFSAAVKYGPRTNRFFMVAVWWPLALVCHQFPIPRNLFFLFKSCFFKFVFSHQGFTKFWKLVCLLNHINNMAANRHASAISGYTLPEQKVSKQQLIKVSLDCLFTAWYKLKNVKISMIFKLLDFLKKNQVDLNHIDLNRLTLICTSLWVFMPCCTMVINNGSIPLKYKNM